MDILGIGPLEFLFILLIALIIFGPRDMVKAGRMLGEFLRKLIRSEGFQTVQKVTRDMRNLPNRLMREAELEEITQELNQIAPPELVDTVKNVQQDIDKSLKTEKREIQQGLSSWTTPPADDDVSARETQASKPETIPLESEADEQ